MIAVGHEPGSDPVTVEVFRNVPEVAQSAVKIDAGCAVEISGGQTGDGALVIEYSLAERT